jgi:hypothetical protein
MPTFASNYIHNQLITSILFINQLDNMTQYVVSIKCSILELAWQKRLSVWKVEWTGVSFLAHSGVHKSILDMHFPVLPILRIVFCFIHHFTYSLVYLGQKSCTFCFHRILRFQIFIPIFWPLPNYYLYH